jgi:hypothetical protein
LLHSLEPVDTLSPLAQQETACTSSAPLLIN